MRQNKPRKDYRPRSDRVPRVEPEERLAVGCHGFVGVPAISAHRCLLSPAQRDRTEPESGRPTCVISSGRSSQEPSEPGHRHQAALFFCHISPRRCAMVAGQIPNPRHEGSTPSTDAFSGIHGYRLEQLTTGHSSHFLPGHRRPRRPSLRRRPCAGEEARDRRLARAGELGHPSLGLATPRGRHQLWASGQATSFGMRTTGVRVPPAGPGARRMLCYRPSGRHERALRRKSAPHPAQGAQRPWLNRREHLPTKQERAGSSPAGRAVSEAEAGEAPGCGPGGSGFEPRRTPSGTTSAGPSWPRPVAVRERTQYLRLWPKWERRLA